MQFATDLHLTAMNKFVLIALSLSILSCQSKQYEGSNVAAPQETAAMKLLGPEQNAPSSPGGSDAEPPLPPQPASSRKIIRNAQLRIRVSDFAASGKAINQAVRQVGGQIANSTEIKSENSIENALIIRIPAAQLDAFLTLILNESIFTDTKTITAEDVTRQYVDVEARIKSKKAVEETYLKLLKQARNVEDVLKIEEQLGAIREDREVQEAELRQLRDEVALSTVNLTYYQQTEAALRPEEPFYKQIGQNIADGFGLVGSALIGSFYFLPIGLILGGIIWLIARWRRQRRKKTNESF